MPTNPEHPQPPADVGFDPVLVPPGTGTRIDHQEGTITIPGLPQLGRSRLATPASVRWVSISTAGRVAVHESPNHTAIVIPPPDRPDAVVDDPLPYQWQLILDLAAVLDPDGRCLADHGLAWRTNHPGWTVADRHGLVLHPCRHEPDDTGLPLNPTATTVLATILATILGSAADTGILAHVRGPVAWLGAPTQAGAHTSIPEELLSAIQRHAQRANPAT